MSPKPEKNIRCEVGLEDTNEDVLLIAMHLMGKLDNKGLGSG